MKRSALRRGTKRLSRSSSLQRGKRLRKIGKRGREAREALKLARAQVLARAGGKCERCGKRGRLDLHHKRMRSQGGGHEASNLVALDRACHMAITDHTAPDWKRWTVSRKAS